MNGDAMKELSELAIDICRDDGGRAAKERTLSGHSPLLSKVRSKHPMFYIEELVA